MKNPGFEREMAAEASTVTFLEETTVRVAQKAQELAPEKTGHYKRKIKARETRVYARDFFWFLVEFGSSNNPAYAPLRRAVVAAGLHLKQSPKK